MAAAWRWLLVPFAALCGPALMVAAYLLADRGLMGLCPADRIVSGACTADWYPAAEGVAVCLSAALGAWVAVRLGSLAAPSLRTRVALAILLAGAAFAGHALYVIGTDVLAPFTCALAGGVAGA